jgi:ABC-2 type transport system ATP-binding protein
VVVEGTPDELKSELRGDTVHVEVRGNAARALGALARVSGLREATADGLRLRARADRGAQAVPAVLAALDSTGVEVVAVTVARPTLDDVYLRHVGSTIEENAA